MNLFIMSIHFSQKNIIEESRFNIIKKVFLKQD
jgi:hypothetical protein